MKSDLEMNIDFENQCSDFTVIKMLFCKSPRQRSNKIDFEKWQTTLHLVYFPMCRRHCMSFFRCSIITICF